MNQLNQYTIEDNYCEPLIWPGWLGLGDPADAIAEAFDEPGWGCGNPLYFPKGSLGATASVLTHSTIPLFSEPRKLSCFLAIWV